MDKSLSSYLSGGHGFEIDKSEKFGCLQDFINQRRIGKKSMCLASARLLLLCDGSPEILAHPLNLTARWYGELPSVSGLA